jgi:hypothetical protein
MEGIEDKHYFSPFTNEEAENSLFKSTELKNGISRIHMESPI